MQQPKTRWLVRRELRKLRLYGCNDAGPQPSRPATLPDLGLYSVHMRNIPAAESGTWATMVRTYREAAGLSQEVLAQEVGYKDRSTIWRMEKQNQKPATYGQAIRIIDRLGIPRDSGLAAAGYANDDAEPDPYAHVREMGLDPHNRIVRYILNMPGISEDLRMRILRREREQQLRDEQRRLEDLEWTLDQQKRQQGSAA